MTQRHRIRNVVLGIACALIVFAQHAALAHAVWHASQQLPQQEERVGDSHRPYAPELSRLCAFDAAFGQILGCAPPIANSIACSAAAHVYRGTDEVGSVALAAFVPRSRGPPALL